MSTSSVARSRALPLLLGESPALVELRRDIQAAARTEAKVLILGETGVGKEVVAQLIHAQSPRVSRPFVAVNCSGIPETLLESELFGHVRGSFTGAYRDKPGLVRQADHGTLFLDELGEMSLRMQAVLLRFAETGEIQPIGSDAVTGRTDVRLITATNRDLRKQIEDGLFREDLYYRLNVIQIAVPPLRQRGEDVLLLLRYYLQRASEAHRLPIPELTQDAERVLLEYPWPGNIRELKNMTERLVVRSHNAAISPDDLPRETRAESAPVVAVALPPAPEDSARAGSPASRRPRHRDGREAVAAVDGRRGFLDGRASALQGARADARRPGGAHRQGPAAHARQLPRAADDVRAADVGLQAVPRVPVSAELQSACRPVPQRQGSDSRHRRPASGFRVLTGLLSHAAELVARARHR